MNNSDELIEEWDWQTARPTGRPVSRAAAHKNGTPHEGVHLWIARISQETEQILFQKRSPVKSSYPDCLDITVGGHALFGQSGSAIEREAYEEIGITISESALTQIGLLRYEERKAGYLHREFQKVFLMLDNRPLEDYKFNDGEVTGICAVAIDDFDKILANNIPIISDFYDGIKTAPCTLSREDFHPELFADSMKQYMQILIPGLRALFKHAQQMTTDQKE